MQKSIRFILIMSLVLIIGIFQFGCYSTPSQTTSRNLPPIEEEMASAQNVLNANAISSSGVAMRRNINNMWMYFAYEAYLYNVPVIYSRIGNNETYAESLGLTLRDFPRSGSTQSLILNQCVEDFKIKSGARPGDYIQLWVKHINEQQFNQGSSPPEAAIIYFVGRIELNGSIRGYIWRKP